MDCVYRIKVLYFLNPHMIWVEIVFADTTQGVDLSDQFKQVGLYGVLPAQCKGDVVSNSFLKVPTQEWTEASIKVTAKYLQEAEELWFMPFRQARNSSCSSIFNDDGHTFGEIYIRDCDDNIKALSILLTKADLAFKSQRSFNKKLCNILKLIQLDEKVANDVIQFIIEKIKSESNRNEDNLKIKAILLKTSNKRELLDTLKSVNFNSSIHGKSMSEINKIVMEKKLEIIQAIEFEGTRFGKMKRPISDSDRTVKQKVDSDSFINNDKNKIETNTISHSSNNIETKKYDKVTLYEKLRKQAEFKCQNENQTDSAIKGKSISKKDERYHVCVPAGSSFTNLKFLPISESIRDIKRVFVLGKSDNRSVERNENESNVTNQNTYNKNSEMGQESNNDNIELLTKSTYRFNITQAESASESSKLIKSDNENCIAKTTRQDVDNVSGNIKLLSEHNLKEMIYSSQIDRNSNSSRLDSNSSSDSYTLNHGRNDRKLQPNIDYQIETMNIDNNKIYYPNAGKYFKDSNINITKISQFDNIDNRTEEAVLQDQKMGFTERIITPNLLLHSNIVKMMHPCLELAEATFVHKVKKNLSTMLVEKPMRVQTIAWPALNRGHSVFIVNPAGSGKTFAYLPPVCSLVSNEHMFDELPESHGPICLILCSSSKSVNNVKKACQHLLGKNLKSRVVAAYAGGPENEDINNNLMNGCSILVATPRYLTHLISLERNILDLKRLACFVVDDADTIDKLFMEDFQKIYSKIRSIIKKRVCSEIKIQYITASRTWCRLVHILSNTCNRAVICIGAYQELVIYSKVNVTLEVLIDEAKITSILDFLSLKGNTKRTVIMCCDDDEVLKLKSVLEKQRYQVLYCLNSMNIISIHDTSKAWNNFNIPGIEPILLCCDVNLKYLCVTDASYLIHYSLPNTFSSFCRRFALLLDNYPNMLQYKAGDSCPVEVKILANENNTDQLPKILNFIKRCNVKIPKELEEITARALIKKDLNRAKNLTPICDNMLTLGECPDIWNCIQRHTLIENYDKPAHWLQSSLQGWLLFKVLHLHSATHYSVRALGYIVDDKQFEFPQTYGTVNLRVSLYYSQEENRRIHCNACPGDICAVETKLNYYQRCLVVRIISKQKTNEADQVLVKFIDEERFEVINAANLLELSKKIQDIPSYVAQVRLVGLLPHDQDTEYTEVSRKYISDIINQCNNLYIRGKILMCINNIVFLDSVECCEDLSSDTVVRHHLKDILKTKGYAIDNPNHLENLKATYKTFDIKPLIDDIIPSKKIPNVIPQAQWAHLEPNDFSEVYVSSVETLDQIYIRLCKWEDFLQDLTKDIQEYATDFINSDKNKRDTEWMQGDLVLAKFPDDSLYHRARLENPAEGQFTCFFVDHGDWRNIPSTDIIPIADYLINKLPFQAIECRMLGLKPACETWTDFSSNFLYDLCLESNGIDLKKLYVRYYLKDSAKYTNGYRYAIVMVDPSRTDSILNTYILNANQSAPITEEIHFINQVSFVKAENVDDPIDDVSSDEYEKVSPIPQSILIDKSECSIVDSDPTTVSEVENDTSSLNSWDVQFTEEDLYNFFIGKENDKLPAITDVKDLKNPPHILNNSKMIELEEKDSEILKAQVSSNSSNLYKPEKSDFDHLTHIENKMSQLAPEVAVINSGTKTKVNIDIHTPKLLWSQDKEIIVLKINLIGVKMYDIVFYSRKLEFNANVNNIIYGFEIDLYGGINCEQCTHVAKGLHIFVRLVKLLPSNWLSLTHGNSKQNWIVYDHGIIEDCSSDSENYIEDEKDNFKKYLVNKMEEESEDSENEFVKIEDDVNKWSFKNDYNSD